MDGLKEYKAKSVSNINGILSSRDYSDHEIVVLAASMIIDKYKPKNLINEELDGVEMYLRMYRETGDPDFLEFARDEFKHSQKPVAALKARLHYAAKEEIELYNKTLERIREIEPALAQP